MKKIILFSSLFFLVTSCFNETKITKGTAPLIDSLEYVSNEIIENLSSGDNCLNMYSSFKLFESLIKRNEIEEMSYFEFTKRYLFTKVQNVINDQKLIIIGMDNDDNTYDMFLVHRTADKLKWEIQSMSREYTRLVINQDEIQYDSLNRIVNFEVEQVWSSDGDLTYNLFYKIFKDTMIQVLHLNSSGGQDIQILDINVDDCMIDFLTYFNSRVLLISEDTLKFEYDFEVYSEVTCENQKNQKDTFLVSKDTIWYYLPEKGHEFKPEWSSLARWDSVQFKSLTDWNFLEGFESEIEKYSQSIESRLLDSSKSMKETLISR